MLTVIDPLFIASSPMACAATQRRMTQTVIARPRPPLATSAAAQSPTDQVEAATASTRGSASAPKGRAPRSDRIRVMYGRGDRIPVAALRTGAGARGDKTCHSGDFALCVVETPQIMPNRREPRGYETIPLPSATQHQMRAFSPGKARCASRAMGIEQSSLNRTRYSCQAKSPTTGWASRTKSS